VLVDSLQKQEGLEARALSPSRENDGDAGRRRSPSPHPDPPRLRGRNGRGLAPSPAVRERSLELNGFRPPSCIAGEGGERSEMGEGFVASQILFQRGDTGTGATAAVGRFPPFFHCNIRLVGKRSRI
jgi:hypothetical protein